MWNKHNDLPAHHGLDVPRITSDQFGNDVLALVYPNHYPGAMGSPPYSPDANPCFFGDIQKIWSTNYTLIL